MNVLRITVLLLLCACRWTPSERPSILLIAIDSMPADTLTCSETDEPGLRAFADICLESVRFTHAYTTSTLSQPALGSILTGLYPHESGLTNNGAQALSSKIRTVGEAAYERGYRTSFISGGAPIFRRSGFTQGFEYFDDNIPVTQDLFYRPIGRSVELFLQWLNKEVAGDPFFSVIFASDLQFTDVSTRNEIGETRAASFSGQFHELDESLTYLFSELKKKGRWDNAYIIVAGLNGVSPLAREGELPGTNLFVENILVPLLIKAPNKKRDYGMNWKIDSNVSLVDLGTTLFDVLGFQPPARSDFFSSLSLKSAISSTQADFSKERMLLVEAGWLPWRMLGSTQFALIKNQYLAHMNGKLRLYNILLDRLQMVPTSTESYAYDFNTAVSDAMRVLGISDISTIDKKEFEKYQLARLLWGQGGVSEENVYYLKNMLERNPDDETLMSWSALVALERRDWKFLNQIGTRLRREEWEFVSRVHLGVSPPKLDRGCFALVDLSVEAISDRQNECDDPLFHDFIHWTKDTGSEKFVRNFRTYLIDRKILMMNYASGYTWETLSRGLLQPHLVELFLSLPENQRLKMSLVRRLMIQDQ